MIESPVLAAGQFNRSRLGSLPPTLEWVGGADGMLRLLDQTRLPLDVAFRDCATAEHVWDAIQRLQVRGAPAIGVAAAYGLYLGVRNYGHSSTAEFRGKIEEVAAYLRSSRPTAVNLGWAVQRVIEGLPANAASSAVLAADALAQAHAIADEDADVCRRIGLAGAHLVPDGGGVLTHCNAGALATVAYGTALSLLYAAHEQGRRFQVYADETRPLLQGARLTAFELCAAGIDVSVLCDSAAASLMQTGKVQVVVVGADRIAANGDTANKIGTYGVAIAARHHRIPFYVAAPRSTFDLSIASGAQIPIEHRSEAEICSWADRRWVPPLARCYNPAFDVTPAELITGIVTEAGIVEPLTAENIRYFFGHRGCNGVAKL